MTRATAYIAHQFQGRGHRPTNAYTHSHKMCDVFRMVRPKNFKVAVQIEAVDPRQQQAP